VSTPQDPKDSDNLILPDPTPAGGVEPTVGVSVDDDRRPDQLPDSPHEGRPSPEAAAKALVQRPKIGDSRPSAATPVTETAAGSSVAAPSGDGTTSTGARKRRRRGGRGRGRAGGAGEQSTQGGQGSPRQGGSRSSSGNQPVTMTTRDDDDQASVGSDVEARRGAERDGRAVGRYTMVVHKRDKATQIAVLEGRSLIEHYVSFPADDVWQIDGNIYLGKVQNVLPGMEAAFVDIGTPKNAVLYRGDVRYESDEVEDSSKSRQRDQKIEQMLRNGQTVLCQVTKNPIGHKGARLSGEVSLPGRFCVFIPNSDTYGISKRLGDDERKRLRRILDDVKPEGHGLIVRTAAEGASADELRRDVARLYKQWQQIETLASGSKAPKLLYREPNAAVRIIREEFNRDFRSVVIDDEEVFNEVRDYVSSISPEMAKRVEFHDPSYESLPVLERFHVHEQLHRALDRKVWLPSGGSLIIERTEALTVIDVNTGKNVGSHSLEETVYQNNLEAADEIARQLRLRDIGGIIVIDFIDMEVMSNRDHVITRFRDALARDKTRTQVFDISELGLVEMTRKRVSEGLVESFSDKCPTCDGRGFVLDRELL
jgi:ribonuclease E